MTRGRLETFRALSYFGANYIGGLLLFRQETVSDLFHIPKTIALWVLRRERSAH